MKGFVVGGERTEGVFVIITTVQVNKPFCDILNLLYVFICMRFLTFKVFEVMGCVSSRTSLAFLDNFFLSPCHSLSLLLIPSLSLSVWGANGIITSLSVLDKHQTPPITAFFPFNLCLSLSCPLCYFLTSSASVMGLFSTALSPHFVTDPSFSLVVLFHLTIFLSVSLLLLLLLLFLLAALSCSVCSPL